MPRGPVSPGVAAGSAAVNSAVDVAAAPPFVGARPEPGQDLERPRTGRVPRRARAQLRLGRQRHVRIRRDVAVDPAEAGREHADQRERRAVHQHAAPHQRRVPAEFVAPAVIGRDHHRVGVRTIVDRCERPPDLRADAESCEEVPRHQDATGGHRLALRHDSQSDSSETATTSVKSGERSRNWRNASAENASATVHPFACWSSLPLTLTGRLLPTHCRTRSACGSRTGSVFSSRPFSALKTVVFAERPMASESTATAA